MKTLILFSLLVGSFYFFESCTKDKTPVPVVSDCADTISYINQIVPILNNNCNSSGCHGNGSAAGGFDLTSHANVSLSADMILKAIRHETASPMPLGASKLNDTLIKQFSCWIAQGKLNN
jgi:hypothetical protein